MDKPVLKVDWATHAAARFACENWHYSKSVPVPPLVKVGAWEDGKYIGAVIFSRGANNNLLKPFGIAQDEGCELTRVALASHKTEVSRVIRHAIRFLLSENKGLRLIVSFADPAMGHLGSIYQAGNWIYTGKQPDTTEYIAPDGKQWHGRMVSRDGKIKVQGAYRLCWRYDQCTPVIKPGKHRYLMPLDAEMRKQIIHLAKPYPKRAGSDTKDMPGSQPGEGGSTPTPALHYPAEAIDG